MSIAYYSARLDSIIPKVRPLLTRDPRVKVAVVFGSILRRDEVRDIDIAVYTHPPLTLKELLLLGDRLEREVGIPIDLIPLDEVDPKLRYKVLMSGLPIVVSDRALYNKLALLALGQVQDVELKVSKLRGGCPPP